MPKTIILPDAFDPTVDDASLANYVRALAREANRNAQPSQLCAEINELIELLIHDERLAIERVYARTYQIVDLHRIGLVTPTEAAIPRLIDLRNAIRRNINEANAFNCLTTLEEG